MHRSNFLLQLIIGLTSFFTVSLAYSSDSLQDGLNALGKGDYPKAYEILLPHGEAGNVNAQYNLGVMYEEGMGASKDYKKAAKWLTLAAKQGDSDAQIRLGLLYENGLGVKADQEEAANWFRKSGEQGNAHGQSNLADYYIDQKNYKEAAIWLEKAGRQGHPYARYLLGVMYIKGAGVEKDLAKAKAWIEAAAAVGQPDAIKLLKDQSGNFSDHLNEALRDLKKRPNGFVVVENTKTGKFIQFAHSSSQKILLNIPYQTLDTAGNERAAAFFTKRGIDAAYSAPAYDPVTRKQVGTQQSYETVLNGNVSEITQMAKEFFLQVYGYNEGFPYQVKEE